MVSAVTTSAGHSEAFARLLQITDYIPVASSVKAIVDLFAKRYWKPGSLDSLSSIKQTYYQHLNEKDNFRYIAAIPVLGNMILIVHDLYQFYVTHKNLATMGLAAYGNNQSLQQFYLLPSAQKKKCLEVYFRDALNHSSLKQSGALRFLNTIVCGKEGEDKNSVQHWYSQNIKSLPWIEVRELVKKRNLPIALASWIADYYINEIVTDKSKPHDFFSLHIVPERADLSDLITNAPPLEKERVLAQLKNGVLSGCYQAFHYLCREEKFWNPPKSRIEWLAGLASTPNTSMNQYAWASLKSYLDIDRDSVLAAYAGMLRMPILPLERFSFICDRFETYLLRGTPAQKEIVQQALYSLADGGNAETIHRVAAIFEKSVESWRATPLYEKAAHANHVDSIVKMARSCIDADNIDGAKFWYSKGRNLPCSSTQLMELVHIDFAIKRKEAPKPDRSFPRRGFSFGFEEPDPGRSFPRRGFFSGFEFPDSDRFFRGRGFFPGSPPGGFEVPEINPQAEKVKEMKADKEELAKVIGVFTTKEELAKNLKKWMLKGHPDKGGKTEEFQRVYALAGKVKIDSGWA